MVYRRDIVELTGEFLAEYETEPVVVDLSPDERAEYEAERGIYRGFVSARASACRLAHRLAASS